ncbi:unnamed protein product [Owenia fusiformis]|uniref:Proline-rich transmembrane protein 3/4 domain-containing protein n=1 Tax=Owenia fusiformis TaxID=6347 RepID=A0A8J1XZV6_OWEFU|nr:unnamed protein product [Owenia fusiformis]
MNMYTNITLPVENVSVVSGPPDVYLPHAEPTLDWPQAFQIWHWAWPLHMYLLGSWFSGLVIYTCVSLLNLRKKIRSNRYLILIDIFVLMAALLRCLYLFLDPYESTQSVPTVVSKLAYALVFPCLTGAFSYIHIMFLKITKMHFQSNRLQTEHCLLCFIIGHFSIVVVIYTIVSFAPQLKLLILIAQTVFIFWGLFLCANFIYSGFRTSQYATETQRALRELTQYSKERKLSKDSSSNMKVLRLTKPKLVIDESHYDFMTDTSSESNTVSYFNESAIDRPGGGRVQQSGTVESTFTIPSPAQENILGVEVDTRHDLTFDSRTCNSSETDSGAIAPQPISNSTKLTRKASNPTTRSLRRSSCSDAIRLVRLFHQRGYEKSNCSSTSSVFTIDDNANSHGFKAANGHINSLKAETDTIGEERGYMADTDSPIRRPKRYKHKGKHKIDHQEVQTIGDSPEHRLYQLKMGSETIMSLYRIRQGRVLHRVLKVAYFTALCGFLCCVLQIYAMFGEYGVLSTVVSPEPWPWYVFQSCARVAELGMLSTMAYITFTTGKYKRKRRGRKRNIHSEDR